MKTIKELYESPKKDENLEKYGHLINQCICCGKPMKDGEKLFVHMNEDWFAVHPGITTEDCEKYTGAKSQGCFPIGNSCAKKMTGFTFKLN
jgi:hypothetical protein